MSTRCQIEITKENGEKVRVYHHCDGYFRGVGAELAAMLQECKTADDLLQKTNPSYEVEDADTVHGDIEFWYSLDFKERKFTGYRLDWPPWTKDGKLNVSEDPKHDNIVDLLKLGEVR